MWRLTLKDTGLRDLEELIVDCVASWLVLDDPIRRPSGLHRQPVVRLVVAS